MLEKGMLGSIYGIPIIESAYLIKREQFRFPKSKGKRIRKKWAKRESNFRSVPATCLLNPNLFGGKTLLVHPHILCQIRNTIPEY